MQLDSTTRGLLGFVLVLTLLLLVQRLVVPRVGAASEMGSQPGRYVFWVHNTNTRAGKMFYRVDTTNGSVWKRQLESDGPWKRLNDRVVVAGTPAAKPYEDPVKDRPLYDVRRKGKVGELSKAWRKIAKSRGIDVETAADLSLLVGLVRTANPVSLRGWAFDQIVGFPAKDAVPALVSLLTGTSPDIQLKVIRALMKKRLPAAIEPLRKLLTSSPHPQVKRAAAKAIEALDGEEKSAV